MDFLGKEREMNVAPRGNVSFTEVKAVVRSYDWGVPIMVIEQRVAAVVWNHIRIGCLLRSRKEFRGCRSRRIGRDAGMESWIPNLILIKELCM